MQRWPGERAGGGGAFRGGTEPVLAERAGPGLLERFWLFWHSTPDQPVAHAAKRATLTQAYLYVQRFDGKRRRVARERLHGVRRTRHRVLVGVAEDDDLVLPHRPGCALQRELIDGLSPGAGAAWATRHYVVMAMLMALVCGFGAFFFVSFTMDDAMMAWREGTYLANEAIPFYAGLIAGALALVSVFWMPMWLRVDRLGVEVRRGMVPWLVFFAPREEVVGSRVRKHVVKNKNGTTETWIAELELRQPMRLGTFAKDKWVRLGEVNIARLDKAQDLCRKALDVLGVRP